ncbi:hypothetical protein SRIMM317S_01611 [Streptomyces rimosus subsp. rimosus]
MGVEVYAVLIALNGFLVIACELLVAKVVQRWRIRTAVIIGVLLTGIGMSMYALPWGLAALVIATLVWSLGEIIGYPSLFFAYPAQAGPPGLRGRYLGASNALYGLGSAIGPFIGVMIWNRFQEGLWIGWRNRGPDRRSRRMGAGCARRPKRRTGPRTGPTAKTRKARTGGAGPAVPGRPTRRSVRRPRPCRRIPACRATPPATAGKCPPFPHACTARGGGPPPLSGSSRYTQYREDPPPCDRRGFRRRIEEARRSAEECTRRRAARPPDERQEFADRTWDGRRTPTPEHRISSGNHRRRGSTQMPRHVALIDPYSEAAEYANAFRARGVEPVAVLSTPAPLKSYLHGWKPEAFHATHFYDGDFAKLAETVRGYDPVAVIPGNESAVRLVDAVVEELTPGAGNVPALSAARRDKWPMAQAVASAGVPHLRTFATASEEEAAGWLRENGLEGQALVLKPRCSGGTDGVHKVEAGEDWRPSFRRLLGSVNMFDLTNDSIVIQEFAPGTEFVVDTYSVDGRMGLVAVVRYSKSARGNRIGVYDAEDYLQPDDPLVGVLESYTRQVADAVGIRTGCTHTEIMLTDDGPRLIEIAARLDGGCAQQAARLATGDCQIDRAVPASSGLRLHPRIRDRAAHPGGVALRGQQRHHEQR